MIIGPREVRANERGIVVFDLGGRRHAVEAGTVERIVTREEDGWIRSTVLGRPEHARRGLVTTLDGRPRTLAVDEVLGVERVPADSIAPLPEVARLTLRTRGIAGLVARDDELLLLVDLPELIRESEEESTSDA